MKIKTKKIIAREFLVILGLLACTLIFWTFLSGRNRFYQNKYDKLAIDLQRINKQIQTIESKYEVTYNKDGAAIRQKKEWHPPDSDPILERLNKKSDPLGILAPKEEPSDQILDSLTALKIEIKRLSDIEDDYSTKIVDDDSIVQRSVTFLIFGLAIIYPLRFLVWSIFWSIKILRSTEND